MKKYIKFSFLKHIFLMGKSNKQACTTLIFGAILSIIVIVILWLAIYFLNVPNSLIVISGKTEIMQFNVANPNLATFDATGFRFYGQNCKDCGDIEKKCLRGAIEPAQRTCVGYRYVQQCMEIDCQDTNQTMENYREDCHQIMEIAFQNLCTPFGSEAKLGIARLKGNSEKTATEAEFDTARLKENLKKAEPEAEFDTAVYFGPVGPIGIRGDFVLLQDSNCGTIRSTRFPVWGPGDVGAPFTFRGDGPSPTLISAEVDIFGRATNISFLSDKREIYPSFSRKLQVPPGSRIETPNKEAGNATQIQAFRGFVVRNKKEGVFDIRLSTEAQELLFHPPGVGLQPDRIRMGLFAQILNDPNIVQIQSIILAFVLILPIGISVVGLFNTNEQSNNNAKNGQSNED